MRCSLQHAFASLLLPVVLLSALNDAAQGSDAGPHLIQDSRLPGGIWVTVGTPTPALAMALAKDPRFIAQSLLLDPQHVESARKSIQREGATERVTAISFNGTRLPYADSLVNGLIISTTGGEAVELTPPEAFRVVAPLGMVYIQVDGDDANEASSLVAQFASFCRSNGYAVPEPVAGLPGWWRVTKPWPTEIDEWSHFLHGADGNPVACDERVAPPNSYQWLGGPRWAQSHETDSNLRCLVTTRGRLYYIVNEAPTSLAGPQSPPDKWFLTARDAFNGVILWKRPIEAWGWRQWKPSWFTPRPGVIPLNLDKRVVADGDRLFATLGYRAPVSELDGRTGKVLRTFAATERTSEILYLNGSLILTVLGKDDALVKRIDVDRGEVVWESERPYRGTIVDYYRFRAVRGAVPEAKVDPTLDLATDGDVVALIDHDAVVGLDFETGRQRWRTRFPLAPEDANAGNIKAEGRAWNGSMIVCDGVVVHASPTKLAAFDGKSGRILWQQPKRFLQHLWYEWQDVFVIDGLVWTWSDQLVRERLSGNRGMSTWPESLNGYDLHNGELVRQVDLGKTFKTHHHHRCYRNKATTRYVIASRRGSEYIDLSGGEHSINNWVRGTCHMGMVPANGLQYAPPHPCQCYIDEKLSGFNALSGHSRESVSQWHDKPPRLERGPAYGTAQQSSGPAAGTSDWPTFRGDARRSGWGRSAMPRELELQWQTAIGSRLGAPICVGDKVYVPSIDEHQVVAIDVDQGEVKWRAMVGGRIDSPPTYDRGAVVFGSADGSVYRVRSSDGLLEWRLQVVPEDRMISADGQLESAWPVHGSVLVDDGVAYFAAGRCSHLDGGLRLVAVDSVTGNVICHEQLDGPHYTSGQIDQNYGLPMGLLSDVFIKEGTDLFLRSVKFDDQLQRQPGAPKLKAVGGLLDDAYFKRMPWTYATSGFARVVVYDDRQVYGLRMFDSLQGLDPKVYFTPGTKGYLLFAQSLTRGRDGWSVRVPIRGRALAVSDNVLCVAGPPDVVDPADPLAAFEGRKGGVLRLVDKMTGETKFEGKLTAPPVFNGAAIANGRLILCLEDGTVACFGRR